MYQRNVINHPKRQQASAENSQLSTSGRAQPESRAPQRGSTVNIQGKEYVLKTKGKAPTAYQPAAFAPQAGTKRGRWSKDGRSATQVGGTPASRGGGRWSAPAPVQATLKGKERAGTSVVDEEERSTLDPLLHPDLLRSLRTVSAGVAQSASSSSWFRSRSPSVDRAVQDNSISWLNSQGMSALEGSTKEDSPAGSSRITSESTSSSSAWLLSPLTLSAGPANIASIILGSSENSLESSKKVSTRFIPEIDDLEALADPALGPLLRILQGELEESAFSADKENFSVLFNNLAKEEFLRLINKLRSGYLEQIKATYQHFAASYLTAQRPPLASFTVNLSIADQYLYRRCLKEVQDWQNFPLAFAKLIEGYFFREETSDSIVYLGQEELLILIDFLLDVRFKFTGGAASSEFGLGELLKLTAVVLSTFVKVAPKDSQKARVTKSFTIYKEQLLTILTLLKTPGKLEGVSALPFVPWQMGLGVVKYYSLYAEQVGFVPHCLEMIQCFYGLLNISGGYFSEVDAYLLRSMGKEFNFFMDKVSLLLADTVQDLTQDVFRAKKSTLKLLFLQSFSGKYLNPWFLADTFVDEKYQIKFNKDFMAMFKGIKDNLNKVEENFASAVELLKPWPVIVYEDFICSNYRDSSDVFQDCLKFKAALSVVLKKFEKQIVEFVCAKDIEEIEKANFEFDFPKMIEKLESMPWHPPASRDRHAVDLLEDSTLSPPSDMDITEKISESLGVLSLFSREDKELKAAVLGAFRELLASYSRNAVMSYNTFKLHRDKANNKGKHKGKYQAKSSQDKEYLHGQQLYNFCLQKAESLRDVPGLLTWSFGEYFMAFKELSGLVNSGLSVPQNLQDASLDLQQILEGFKELIDNAIGPATLIDSAIDPATLSTLFWDYDAYMLLRLGDAWLKGFVAYGAKQVLEEKKYLKDFFQAYQIELQELINSLKDEQLSREYGLGKLDFMSWQMCLGIVKYHTFAVKSEVRVAGFLELCKLFYSFLGINLNVRHKHYQASLHFVGKDFNLFMDKINRLVIVEEEILKNKLTLENMLNWPKLRAKFWQDFISEHLDPSFLADVALGENLCLTFQEQLVNFIDEYCPRYFASNFLPQPLLGAALTSLFYAGGYSFLFPVGSYYEPQRYLASFFLQLLQKSSKSYKMCNLIVSDLLQADFRSPLSLEVQLIPPAHCLAPPFLPPFLGPASGALGPLMPRRTSASCFEVEEAGLLIALFIKIDAVNDLVSAYLEAMAEDPLNGLESASDISMPLIISTDLQRASELDNIVKQITEVLRCFKAHQSLLQSCEKYYPIEFYNFFAFVAKLLTPLAPNCTPSHKLALLRELGITFSDVNLSLSRKLYIQLFNDLLFSFTFKGTDPSRTFNIALLNIIGKLTSMAVWQEYQPAFMMAEQLNIQCLRSLWPLYNPPYDSYTSYYQPSVDEKICLLQIWMNLVDNPYILSDWQHELLEALDLIKRRIMSESGTEFATDPLEPYLEMLLNKISLVINYSYMFT